MSNKIMALSSVLSLSICVSGCGNPYAVGAGRLNYNASEAPGSILFTDPKLYKREALINERRKEVEYLNKLIDDSKDVTFTPEISRELQTVATISAALGAKFDPAAAINYRRDAETGAIQQEMQVIKLQLQLDQLKRDAELFRQGLQTQTTPVNTGLGTGAQAPSDASSPAGAAATERLNTAIEALQRALATANVTNATALQATTLKSNPIDEFLDRSAYRGLLNSAKNAANLDELHDKEGAALVRLSLTATLLPPLKDYQDTLGVLRMTINPPDWRGPALERLYRDWIDYINDVMNRKDDNAIYSEDPELIGLRTVGDLFDVVYYYFGDKDCPGIALKAIEGSPCKRLTLAVPRTANTMSLLNVGRDRFENSVDIFAANSESFNFDRMFGSAASQLLNSGNAPIFQKLTSNGKCLIDPVSSTLKKEIPAGEGRTLPLRSAIAAALDLYWVTSQLSIIEIQAQRTLRGSGVQSRANLIESLARANWGAGRVITALTENGRHSQCSVSVGDFVKAYVPPRFADRVINDSKVTIYEVGPREQVQQLSTLARASEAIGLAAAIAGQIPSQGIGIDSNIAFSRSASGKADALERVPVLISFAEPSASLYGADGNADKDFPDVTAPAFGWLLGPRMALDPEKQSMVLEHRPRPYDLSVDLSVPGWWPSLTLETTTAWAPNWRNGRGQILTAPMPGRRVPVGLSPNRADFASLTDRLRGTSSIRRAEIREVRPSVVSACAADLSLEVVGDGIWRSESVLVGGRQFDTSKISILPDMRGVLVKIDQARFPARLTGTDMQQGVDVVAMTPYGAAPYRVRLVDAKEDGTCKFATPTPGSDQNQSGTGKTK